MMANPRVGKTISDDRLEELQCDFDGWSRDALGKAGSFDRDVAAALMELRARRRAADEKSAPLETPKGHDAAQARIAACVREIEIICDEFGYDPTEWLIPRAARQTYRQQ